MGLVRVKMCGMTLRQDIEVAASFGVDAVGLIFYSESPRSITVTQAQQLTNKLPPFMSIVAVFVNPKPQLVHEVLEAIPVHVLQFHGDESSDFCRQFSRPYVKAVSADSVESIVKATKNHPYASGILLDTPSIKRGGSGQSFDWELIPHHLSLPMILAGGLNARNVADAVSGRTVYAVDVCSGVEASPGIKDHNKMRQFMQTIHKMESQ
ncbi:phosphoribosylanthranilate isomerase [Legionella yabuuchiae]|uniref:phosphoribosylanthranilate isomerase n=1 Tax=Legionella yabuuchiae TaxID=376727 RepID=UPI0013EF6724|nr:phosphoribosylanthranilate isomerase [Legionella yabuuchiae]